MKKLLLIVMVVGFAFASIAQNMTKSNVYKLRVADGQEVYQPSNLPIPEFNAKSTNEDVNRIPLGTSAHARILRREECKVISYNPALDVISVTFILDPDTYDEADEPGIVGQMYSLDHGQTWEGPVVLANDLDLGANFYLSGAIYNPDGNSDITAAYGVSQGTINPPDQVWNIKSFGSSSIGGDNQSNLVIKDDSNDENGYWNIFGLGQVADEMRCMNLIPEGAWGGYTAIALEPTYGSYNGSGFDWDYDVVDVDLIVDVTNEGAFWQGRWQGYDASTEIAWSADGEIGYMWVIGISEEEFSGIQPQVYKTEDGGESWDYIFLDFQTDEIQALLDPFIIETSGGYMAPAFFESAGVVNVNGELELFGAMGAHSSDFFAHPDSIGWQWTIPGDIANVTIDMDGIQNLIWIDSLLTENVVADTEGNYAGSGWQHRIHASKNVDGSQVFVTWTETREVGAEFNLNPDIFGWSKGVCDNPIEMDPICFTEGTLYETFYYFNSSADIAYDNGDGYTIPTMQGITPGEFSTNGSATADPITLNYVTGIEFPILCTVGLDELAQSAGVTVTQNQPNPFNGETYIEVSTETAAAVMVEVSNIMGQTIYTINAGTINGSKTISLNSENMEAGVYFYTVTVGSEKITKKMVVK